MWLDELADLVRTLRERIEKHGNLLRQNETRTRYALIDPVLEALGWHLRDPSEVIPEYSTGEGRADYALLGKEPDPTPVLLVEAKKLGTPLENRLGQAITYCNEKGVKYFAVTDGERWAVYETFKPVPNPQKLIMSFAMSMPDSELVMKMLWLWRGNFIAGQPALPSEGPASQPPVAPSEPQPAPPLRDWVPLDKFQPRLKARPPEAIRFSGSQQRPVARWNELQVRVVEWLVLAGKLNRGDCPVTTDRGTHLVHTEPTRKNGTRFIEPRRVGNLWVEVSYDAVDHVRQAVNILGARGVDPATVHILPHSD